MVVNDFKRKHITPEYLKALKQLKNLDWTYVYSNKQLKEITKTADTGRFKKRGNVTKFHICSIMILVLLQYFLSQCSL